MQPKNAGESKELLRASSAARRIERRLFLKQGLSLGALTLLTGCDVTDTSAVQSVLDGISHWNDRAQAALFNPRRLMPTYPESQAVKDFRFNAYYGARADSEDRRRDLQAQPVRADRQPQAVDPAGALRTCRRNPR